MSTPCRKPAGPYLIESAPNYRQYLAAKSAREIVQRIMSPMNAAVSGYQSEPRYMLDAGAIYLWPGS